MKVVVIAHPRSGSNSLVEILQAHPQIGFIENEPFAEGYVDWDPDHVDFRARLRNGEPFDDLVSEIFASRGGLKELSYQLDRELLSRLARRRDVRCVTLRRRNVLATSVSQVIAEQTELWKTWDATKPLDEYYRDIGALDIALVRERMDWTLDEIARIDECTRDVGALDLVYEELFTGPAEYRLAIVDSLWEFLCVESVDTAEIRHYLSPAVQQSRLDTYGHVTNLAEIEAALGDDVTGRLTIGAP